MTGNSSSMCTVFVDFLVPVGRTVEFDVKFAGSATDLDMEWSVTGDDNRAGNWLDTWDDRKIIKPRSGGTITFTNTFSRQVTLKFDLWRTTDAPFTFSITNIRLV